jgi:hypothetical protein
LHNEPGVFQKPLRNVEIGYYFLELISKLRQIGEADLASVDVEAAELGAAVELWEELARVEDLTQVRRRT